MCDVAVAGFSSPSFCLTPFALPYSAPASDSAYLAIGPNDDHTAIHSPNESLPVDTLVLSAEQFQAVLTAAAAG